MWEAELIAGRPGRSVGGLGTQDWQLASAVGASLVGQSPVTPDMSELI